MENFSKDLKTLALEVIKTEKKEMIPLTNDEIKYYEKCKCCHIRKKKFYNDENDEKIQKIS